MELKLQIIMLSKISQAQEDKCNVFTHMQRGGGKEMLPGSEYNQNTLHL
jgi:hypothetical protein